MELGYGEGGGWRVEDHGGGWKLGPREGEVSQREGMGVRRGGRGVEV